MKREKHPDPQTEWNELIDARHELLKKLGRLQRKIDKLEPLVDERVELESAVMKMMGVGR